MDIKILGTGCSKCRKLEKLTQEVVKEMGIDADIQEVKDMKKVMEYPILMTPGLVINGELILSGKVPDKGKLTQHIVNALAKEG